MAVASANIRAALKAQNKERGRKGHTVAPSGAITQHWNVVDLVADDIVAVCAEAPTADPIAAVLLKGAAPWAKQEPPKVLGVEVEDIMHVVELVEATGKG